MDIITDSINKLIMKEPFMGDFSRESTGNSNNPFILNNNFYSEFCLRIGDDAGGSIDHEDGDIPEI